MSEPECRHGMNPAWCADCTGRDGGEKAERRRLDCLLALSGVVAAQYPGNCDQCGERFGVDDPIKASRSPAKPGTGVTGWLGPCCFA